MTDKREGLQGDPARVRDALASEGADGVKRELDDLRALHEDIVATYIEWVVIWKGFLRRMRGDDASSAVLTDALTRWARWLACGYPVPLASGVGRARRREKGRDVMEALVAARSVVGAGDAAWASEALLTMPRAAASATIRLAREGRALAANAAFARYLMCVRERHDVLVMLHGAIDRAVIDKFGQALFEQGMRETLAACSYHDVAWRALDGAKTAAVAAAIARELQGHFSGPDRIGRVRFEQVTGGLRVAFEPCGSGGMLRRSPVARSLGVLADATAATWGRAGEVPPYCSHCALEESESLARFGRHLWVTEFVPGSDGTCAWRVAHEESVAPPNGAPS